jgi:steroid delta-isomerase-like uncharacterized protein
MTTESIRAFIERHTAGWNRRDAVVLAQSHAADGVVVSPMFGRVEGRTAIGDTYATLFSIFPDWEITFDQPIADNMRLAVSFSVKATHQGDFMGYEGTGRRCSFEGVSLFEMTPNGLIAAERRVYDFTGLLAQLGVLRVRPAR